MSTESHSSIQDACLTDEQLELLATNQVDPEQADRLRAHIAQCPHCRKLLTECTANQVFLAKVKHSDTRTGTHNDAGEATADGTAGPDEKTVLATPTLLDNEIMLPAPDSIAGYRLTRELHRGGQGVIYQAVQESTKRKVAIKVMKEGPFGSGRDRSRFEREVQILGALNHPSIVTIYDSGVAAGCFYFVMDYISGQSLDVHMANTQRPIEDTLKLFGKICEAVSAAHLQGIIHRDLKPSNIRVDDTGAPHVLDFGLAKVSLAGGAEDTTLEAMTMTGQFMGSLPWASPEQAEAIPGKIDVRTDVYALGVILYHMLTGKFPYDVTGNMRDVLDRIMREEPTPPSQLRRNINDEVETIVLKCLAKERDRRYQSAGELARDIQRYLAGEAIEAKRDSAWYLLKKMVRRYKAPAAVGAGFVLLLLFGFTTTAGLYFRAEQLKQRAVQQKQLAVFQRDRAKLAEWQAQERTEQRRWMVYTSRIALADSVRDSDQVVRMNEYLFSCPPDLRGWEWYHLVHIADHSQRTLHGHHGPINDVDLDASGELIASGSDDGTVRLWNARTGRLLHTLTAETRVVAAAVQPQGSQVAGLDANGTVTVWDTRTGNERAQVSVGPSPCTLAWSPDGQQLAAAARTLRIWRSSDLELEVEYAMKLPGTTCLTYTPDGQYLLLGLEDTPAFERIDTRSGERIQRWDLPAPPTAVLSLSGTGDTILWGDRAGRIRRQDPRTDQRQLDFQAHRGPVTGLGLDPSRGVIVSCGNDNALSVWDAHTGARIDLLRGHDAGLRCMAMAPAGLPLVTGSVDHTLKLWSPTAPPDVRALPSLQGRALDLAWHPQGRWLGAVGDAPRILLWPAEPPHDPIRAPGHPGGTVAIAFSPDGEHVATAGRDRRIVVRDLTTGRPTHGFDHPDAAITTLAYLPKSAQTLVTGGADGDVRIWDLDTPEPIRTLSASTGPVTTAAVSPDGHYLATAGNQGTINIWQVADGTLLTRLRGHEGAITKLAFGPTSERLASAGKDATVRLWRIGSAKPVLPPLRHREPVTALAFHPSGKRIVSASTAGTVKIWDTQTGTETFTLTGYYEPILALSFSPDPAGRYLATGTGDGRIELREATSAEKLHQSPAAALRLARNARALAEQNHIEDALQLFAEALEMHRRLLGPNDPRTEELLREETELRKKQHQPVPTYLNTLPEE